jgi:hypothetical protein
MEESQVTTPSISTSTEANLPCRLSFVLGILLSIVSSFYFTAVIIENDCTA